MTFAVGIDLGNTNERIAVFDSAGNPVMVNGPTGEPMIRSAVYINEDGSVVVGLEAYNRLLADPAGGALNWKRFLGRKKVLVERGGRKYLAQDFAKILLEFAIKLVQQKTGQIPTDVAISVPANFTDEKKQLVLTAAVEVGINVICLPSEPAAALLGAGVHKRADGRYFVFDVGGCTKDVSVATKTGSEFVIDHTDGEAQIGGQDYNNRLEKMVLDRFEEKHKVRLDPKSDPMAYQDLVHRVEQAKIALSTRDRTSIVISSGGKVLDAVITRKEFEAATADLTDKGLACVDRTLKAAGVKPEELKEVHVVGGGAQLPALMDGIHKILGRNPSAQCEPLFATAMGAAIAARLEVEKAGRRLTIGNLTLRPLTLSLREVTGNAIGVGALRDGMEVVNSVLIPKATPIPAEIIRRFKLHEAGQTDALIEILQGTDGAARDQCLLLGHFELKGMKAVTDEAHVIETRLRLDKNGLLSASAHDPLSGVQAELIIDYKTPPSPASSSAASSDASNLQTTT